MNTHTATNIRRTRLTTRHIRVSMTQRDVTLHMSNFLEILRSCKNIIIHLRTIR